MEAVIYLADSRKCTQETHFRSYHTLGHGRAPFGDLRVFNDETLSGHASTRHAPSSKSMVIVVPLVGDVLIEHAGGDERLSAGQALALFCQPGVGIQLRNPFEKELINYLYIEMACDAPIDGGRLEGSFDLATQPNALVPLFAGTPAISLYIGQYEGRYDDIFIPPLPTNSVFAFVIEGAFEFQNRLLQPRDALSLTDVKSIDFEALANGVILVGGVN